MVYKCFDKTGSATPANKFFGSGGNMSDWQLVQELHKTIIRKFKKRKVYSTYIDNIWSAELADMQLISIFNKRNFLFCIINIFSKNARVIPLKGKEGIVITNSFQNILQKPNQKIYG